MWADKFSPKMRKIIEQARRVVIHPDVMSMVLDLVAQGEEKIKKVAPYAVFPDYETWIEGVIESDKGPLNFGFYFTGTDTYYVKGEEKDSVDSGMGFITICNDPEKMHDPSIISVRYNLREGRLDYRHLAPVFERIKTENPSHFFNDPIFMRSFQEANVVEKDPIAVAAGSAAVRKIFANILVAILALMNSPKLVRTEEHTLDKFNARRLKRGKYPYFPHHQVYLNVDKHALKVQKGQGDGPERALHFVRAHPRFYVHPRYKEASVVIVQPHWRGNPELGIKNPTYNVEREGSVWPDRIAGA